MIYANLINNLTLNCDSYKLSHFEQYPEDTTKVFSYIEARGSGITDEMMVFGMQYFIKTFLNKPITREDIEFGEMFAEAHGLPYNKAGWERILDRHGGHLPLKIDSLPEGTVTPLSTAVLTVTNTDPEAAWLTSLVETALLRAMWYPSTVATLSYLAKKIIYSFLEKTSDNPEGEIWFKLHDFGARGVSSLESAALGGLAHLVNFRGSDTVSGILLGMEYYDSGVCGYSIPAAEHSTMTILGREGEFAQMERMVEKFAVPGKMFAVVSDSYDIYKAVEDYWCRGGLLAKVKERGATCVIRPDSGSPVDVPVEIVELLMKYEGYTINSKGYKVLPDHVRVIQGDGMNLATIEKLYENLEKKKLSVSNVTVGMGGGLLQKLDRDTLKWAMKASYAEVGGVPVDVYKDPITDNGKRSKRGILTTVLTGDKILTKRIEEVLPGEENLLVTIYNNGPITEAFETFDVIRDRANKSFKT